MLSELLADMAEAFKDQLEEGLIRSMLVLDRKLTPSGYAHDSLRDIYVAPETGILFRGEDMPKELLG